MEKTVEKAIETPTWDGTIWEWVLGGGWRNP
jgi:hypothetical protein